MKQKYEIGEKVKLANVTLTSKSTGEETTLLDDAFYTLLRNDDLVDTHHIHVYAVCVQVCYYRPIGVNKHRYFGKVLNMCSSYFSLNQNEDFANLPDDIRASIDATAIHENNLWQPRGLTDALLPNVVFLTRDYFSFFISKMSALHTGNTKLIVDKVSSKFDEVHSPSNHFDSLSEEEKKTDVRDFTYTAINTINDALYQQKETVLLRARLYCYKALKMPDEIKDTFLDIVSIYLGKSCFPALSRGRYIADDIVYKHNETGLKHTYFLNAAFFLDKSKFNSVEEIEDILIKAWIGAVGYSRQEYVDVLEKEWVTLDRELLYATSRHTLSANYEDYSYCIQQALPFLLDRTDKAQQISYSQQYQRIQTAISQGRLNPDGSLPASINGWEPEKMIRVNR